MSRLRRSSARRSISVVLPAHNEEAVIDSVVTRCVETMTRLRIEFEVIVVDDGSIDNTGRIADRLALADRRVRVVHTRTQRGYGGALREGFAAAAKASVFFMDADEQFDIQEIEKLIQRSDEGHRVVIGYRAKREDSMVRKINAWAWGQLVRRLLHFQARDIDCAFKLYEAGLIACLDVQSSGAMINTEMLAKLARIGVTPAEVAVTHYPRVHGDSTGANVAVIIRAFRELFRFRTTLRAWKPSPINAMAETVVLRQVVERSDERLPVRAAGIPSPTLR